MIDLHTHSTASDGTCTPSELVAAAVKNQLKAIALTDHDTIAGIREFLAAAASHPELTAIAGVEFSCRMSSGDHCHMVGLFIDPENARLQETCVQYCQWRDERNANIIRLLNEAGYPITMDDVLAERSVPGVIGRPHVAAALLAHGHVSSMRAAFEQLLGRGRPAFTPRKVLPAATCLETIHAAGGLAFWAHPMTRDNMTVAKCERYILELKEFGLDGIEAYYADHTMTQTRNVLTLARRHGLLVSGGSDFHGANHQGVALGSGYGHLHVPNELLDEILRHHQG